MYSDWQHICLIKPIKYTSHSFSSIYLRNSPNVIRHTNVHPDIKPTMPHHLFIPHHLYNTPHIQVTPTSHLESTYPDHYYHTTLPHHTTTPHYHTTLHYPTLPLTGHQSVTARNDRLSHTCLIYYNESACHQLSQKINSLNYSNMERKEGKRT